MFYRNRRNKSDNSVAIEKIIFRKDTFTLVLTMTKLSTQFIRVRKPRGYCNNKWSPSQNTWLGVRHQIPGYRGRGRSTEFKIGILIITSEKTWSPNWTTVEIRWMLRATSICSS